MERLTRVVLRHRWLVLAGWIAIVAVCGFASSGLSDLLTNRFTLPGTDTARAETILEEQFGQRSTGSFTLVVAGRRAGARSSCRRCARPRERAPERAADGQGGGGRGGERGRRRRDIVSDLDPADAKGHTEDMREAVGTIPGAEDWLTGQAATEHDLDPVFAEDLQRGELFMAVPIALLLLIFTFGTLAFLLPFLFAAVTIPTTLGIVWIFANFMELTTYLTNLVSLIGLGIAIDYSLLIVYRFREELAQAAGDKDDAIVRTMATAGRAVVFSGTAVAIGLALLLFMPLPFMRGFGVGGLIIPAVSVLARRDAPARAAVADRQAARPRAPAAEEGARAARQPRARLLAGARPHDHAPARAPFAIAASAFLLLLTLPVLDAAARAGLERGHPAAARVRAGARPARRRRSARERWRRRTSSSTPAEAAAPTDGEVAGGVDALTAALEADPAIAAVRFEPASRQHVDESGRYLTSRRSAGGLRQPDGLEFVDRLRGELVPAAGFPRRRPCTRAAALRAASTSSTSPTAGSRGSCLRCCSPPTCCWCARSAHCSCR